MARNSKVSLVLAGVVVIITILAGVANAGVTPSVFATKEKCESAVNAGEGAYKFYVPKYLGGSKKNPVDGGATKVVAPLEAVACVHMDTTAGKKWVVQPEGAEFRFKLNADNSLEDTPYARHDCGNKVYGISYPAPEVPEKKVAVETPRTGYQVGDPCTAKNAKGETFPGFIKTVYADGSAECVAETTEVVPGYGIAVAQYIICPIAGGYVGYVRSGAPGAITGAVSGIIGTASGRYLGGEKRENWTGWAGCITGPVGGLVKWGKGGSLVKGAPVNPPLPFGPVSPPLW